MHSLLDRVVREVQLRILLDPTARLAGRLARHASRPTPVHRTQNEYWAECAHNR